MSIEYTIFEDDNPAKEIVLTVSLSNGTHCAWQDEVGLHRLVKMKDTQEIEQRHVHTTIHDTERQSFCISWLEQYFDKLGDDEPLSELLTELLDAAEENGSTLIYVQAPYNRLHGVVPRAILFVRKHIHGAYYDTVSRGNAG